MRTQLVPPCLIKSPAKPTISPRITARGEDIQLSYNTAATVFLTTSPMKQNSRRICALQEQNPCFLVSNPAKPRPPRSRPKPPWRPNLTPPFDLVELPRGPDLCPRPLSAHRQVHGVTLATVRAHVTQAFNIVLYFFPCIVLDLHRRQLSC